MENDEEIEDKNDVISPPKKRRKISHNVTVINTIPSLKEACRLIIKGNILAKNWEKMKQEKYAIEVKNNDLYKENEALKLELAKLKREKDAIQSNCDKQVKAARNLSNSVKSERDSLKAELQALKTKISDFWANCRIE